MPAKKFDEAKEREIARLYSAGEISLDDLCARYGITDKRYPRRLAARLGLSRRRSGPVSRDKLNTTAHGRSSSS